MQIDCGEYQHIHDSPHLQILEISDNISEMTQWLQWATNRKHTLPIKQHQQQ